MPTSSKNKETPPRKKLGEILIESGVITPHQLQTALRSQQEYGGRLGAVLVRLGFISERNLVLVLKKHLDIPGVDLERYKIEASVLNALPKDLSKKFQVLPLAVKKKGDKKFLFLAMSDPTNLEAIDEIRFKTDMIVKPVVASDGQLIDAIGIYYDGLSIAPQVNDFHTEISLDPNDSGEMTVFQGGHEYDMSDGRMANIELPDGPLEESSEVLPEFKSVKAAKSKSSKAKKSADASRSQAKTQPPSAPGSNEDTMKLAMGLAQLLIDRGIITKRELIDLIKGD